jgi:L-ribulose-5-phosphate 3-epimerase
VKNLVTLNSNTYHGFSLDEAINGTAKAGFRYIELAAVRGYTEHLSSDMSDKQLVEVKAKLQAHGLECIALAGHSNLMSSEGIESFAQNIGLAKRMGCKFIITATGEAHDDHDEIEDDAALATNLKPLLQLCEESGIMLVIETHGNNYATGQAVKSLVNNIGSPFLGINYDTANVIFYGNVLPYEDLEASADEVKFIHLKDKRGAMKEWDFPAIGQGTLDFARIFSILHDAGCTAPLSVEIEFTSAGPANLAEVDEAVAESYRAIEQVRSGMNH